MENKGKLILTHVIVVTKSLYNSFVSVISAISSAWHTISKRAFQHASDLQQLVTESLKPLIPLKVAPLRLLSR